MTERNPFQFSILSLLIVTTLFACLLGTTMVVGRAVGLDESVALAIVLSRQIIHVPILIVWLVGGAIIVHRRQRHPKASRLALAGLVGLFVLSIASSMVDVWIAGTVTSKGVQATNIAVAYSVTGFVESLLAAGCWSLLLIAVVTGRAEPKAAVLLPETMDGESHFRAGEEGSE
jgi:hypothetical protein